MTKRKPAQSTTPNSADVGMALLSGDAFYRLARDFLSRAPNDISSARDHAIANVGDLVASATNMALAIEIYIKALLLYRGCPAPKTHELPDLYSKLPVQTRLQAEQAYSFFRKTEKKGATAAFVLHISDRNASTQLSWNSMKPQDESLHGLLKQAASAFVTWRYLFSHESTAGGPPLQYNFLRMSFAAQALRDQFGQVSATIDEPVEP